MIRKYFLPGKATLLRDLIFAADDGMLTTFVVIAGSTGASFSNNIIIALGLANIFADGIVMATGLYLGIKSELELTKADGNLRRSEGLPLAHGGVTFISFVLCGLLPLLPFLLPLKSKFFYSCIIIVLSLFLVGVFKAVYTKKNIFKGGLEILLIGGVSAIVAFAVGYLADIYII